MSSNFSTAEKKALMELPGFSEIKKAYSQQGMGRMSGKGFWDDLWSGIKSTAKSVDAWLTRTKALSTAGKVIGAITAVIPGLQGVAPVALAAAKAGEAMGYGKKHTGKGKLTPQSFATHVNPVAGRRGFVSQGMGTMTQDFQSPSMKKLGVRGGSLPSHLQPFLTTRKIGGSVATAIGSIGSTQKLKF
jgi:hypothetical protein